MIGQSLRTIERESGRPFEASPAHGIYYVVRYPEGWDLEFVRTSDVEQDWDGEHSAWWTEELAHKLAVAWTPLLKTNFSYIEHQLKSASHAFPRGRVESNPPTIFWGNNLTAQMRIAAADICRAFGFRAEIVKWHVSQWEMANQEDRDLVRGLIGIQENWPVAPKRQVR